MLTAADRATTFNSIVVTFARPCDEVWELFLDRSKWLPSFVLRRVLRGTADEMGSLAVVESRSESGASERFEETLVSDPGRRLVVRIWSETAPLVAHADFLFDPVPEGCRVIASIHGWLLRETGGEAARLSALTQTNIVEVFEHLREVAEGSIHAR